MTRLPLAVSLGEPAGIGPDIILSSWAELRSQQPCDTSLFFYVYGCAACLERRVDILGIDCPVVKIFSPDEATNCFFNALPVIDLPLAHEVVAGHLDKAAADMVITAIRNSVFDVISGKASGVVTAPIHKSILYEAGFKFPGHTEFLASLAADHYGRDYLPVMMLASDELKVVPVTIHIPLSKVPDTLSKELIIKTVEILHHDLCDKFGLSHPKIHITGLNPHAGEAGTLGREDDEIILPALEALKAKGIDVTGPHPADVSFHAAARKTYDAVAAMYHDQALIPIKTLAFDEGVNVTLGLPFIRTSPDHGTALDIAGSGKAKPNSFIAALRMAQQMATAAEKKHD